MSFLGNSFKVNFYQESELNPFSDFETAFTGFLYLFLGFSGILILVFVILTLIKQLKNKKGIYSLYKGNIWFEVLINLHLFKNGFGNLIDINNKIVCKVDSGFTFFSMNMATFYYSLIIGLLIYNKGHYPKITKYERLFMLLPAVLIGIISVYLLFSFELSGVSPWHTCYIKHDITIALWILFIPQFIYLIFSLVFFGCIYLKYFSLQGIVRHFQIFTFFNSILMLLLCISYYIKSSVLGIISMFCLCLSMIIFRLFSDIIICSFSNGISSNKFIHFLATLLCIDSPPIESLNLDLEKEEKLVRDNISKEKEQKKNLEIQKEKIKEMVSSNKSTNSIKSKIELIDGDKESISNCKH